MTLALQTSRSCVRTTEILYPVLCIICDVTSCVSPSRRKMSFWILPPSGTQERENMPNSLKYVPYPCYIMCFCCITQFSSWLNRPAGLQTECQCLSSLLHLSICVNLPCKQQRSAETSTYTAITSTTVDSCSHRRTTATTDIQLNIQKSFHLTKLLVFTFRCMHLADALSKASCIREAFLTCTF